MRVPLAVLPYERTRIAAKKWTPKQGCRTAAQEHTRYSIVRCAGTHSRGPPDARCGPVHVA
eukprot:2734830-Prymnesium_polylepis.1